MVDMIVAGIVLIIIGAAAVYIFKSKKNGVKCIGCPAGASCSSKNNGNCACGCHSDINA